MRGAPEACVTAGQVFTPLHWARWVVESQGVLEAWLSGARVMDPTAGDGSFVEALVSLALERGFAAKTLPLDRLIAVECDERLVRNMRDRLRGRYDVELKSVFTRDVLELSDVVCDVLVGNPPWINFGDLPANEKERLKPRFRALDLTGEPRSLLWGASRVDVAVLIVAHAIRRLLAPRGRAFFFLPLGMYLGGDGGRGFRRHRIDGVPFATRSIYEFRRTKVFPRVHARYGLVCLERDVEPVWPIDFWVEDEGLWKRWVAAPSDGGDGPLCVAASGRELVRAGARDAASIRPRQGVNTCGATDVFVFDQCVDVDDELVAVSNRASADVVLPRRFVLPLASNGPFGSEPPSRWVLVPHERDSGRPLATLDEPSLRDHLVANERRLRARKGPVLRRFIDRGQWWALLGVGPYAFAPFKVMWRAAGARELVPFVVPGRLQGNQALHAYVPAATRDDAEAIAERLRSPEVQRALAAQRTAGTASFAQPGNVARVLDSARRAS